MNPEEEEDAESVRAKDPEEEEDVESVRAKEALRRIGDNGGDPGANSISRRK